MFYILYEKGCQRFQTIDTYFYKKYFTPGFGDRREMQALPKNSEKEALEWTGEIGFNQVHRLFYLGSRASVSHLSWIRQNISLTVINIIRP